MMPRTESFAVDIVELSERSCIYTQASMQSWLTAFGADSLPLAAQGKRNPLFMSRDVTFSFQTSVFKMHEKKKR